MMARKVILGVAITLAGSCLYVFMNICIKYMLSDLAPSHILLLQSLSGFLCIVLLLKQQNYRLTALILSHKRNYLLRNLFSLASIYCLLIALPSVRIFNALVILNSAPLVMPFMKKFFRQDLLQNKSLLVALLGFVGIILILAPNKQIFSYGTIIIILAMFFMALSLMMLENQPGLDANLMLFYYFFYSVTILSMISLPVALRGLSVLSLLIGILVGVVFFAVQWSIIAAAQLISAQLIAILFYSEVVLAWLFSTLFEDLHLTPASLTGTILVILSGIFAIGMEPKSDNASQRV